MPKIVYRTAAGVHLITQDLPEPPALRIGHLVEVGRFAGFVSDVRPVLSHPGALLVELLLVRA